MTADVRVSDGKMVRQLKIEHQTLCKYYQQGHKKNYHIP